MATAIDPISDSIASVMLAADVPPARTPKVSIAEQHQNPGNIRIPGTTDFRTYNSPEEGFQGLQDDLDAKKSGKTDTGLNGESSLYDFSNAYAPAKDKNNPKLHAEGIAQRLGVAPTTQIGSIPTRDFAAAVAGVEDSKYWDKVKDQVMGPADPIGDAISRVMGTPSTSPATASTDDPIGDAIAKVMGTSGTSAPIPGAIRGTEAFGGQLPAMPQPPLPVGLRPPTKIGSPPILEEEAALPQPPPPVKIGTPSLLAAEPPHPRGAIITPSLNQPISTFPPFQPPTNEVRLPIIGTKVNIPGAGGVKEVLGDSLPVMAYREFSDLVYGFNKLPAATPGTGIPDALINGVLRLVGGLSEPETIATVLAGAGLAKFLPALAQVPAIAKAAETVPGLASGMRIAANAGVPAAFAATTAAGSLKSGYKAYEEAQKGNIPGAVEAGVESLGSAALSALAARHAGTEAGKVFDSALEAHNAEAARLLELDRRGMTPEQFEQERSDLAAKRRDVEQRIDRIRNVTETPQESEENVELTAKEKIATQEKKLQAIDRRTAELGREPERVPGTPQELKPPTRGSNKPQSEPIPVEVNGRKARIEQLPGGFSRVVDEATGRVLNAGRGSDVESWLASNGARRPGAPPELESLDEQYSQLVAQHGQMQSRLHEIGQEIEGATDERGSELAREARILAQEMAVAEVNLSKVQQRRAKLGAPGTTAPGTKPAAAATEPVPAPETEEAAPAAGPIELGSTFNTPDGTYRVRRAGGGTVTYELTSPDGVVSRRRATEEQFRRLTAQAEQPDTTGTSPTGEVPVVGTPAQAPETGAPPVGQAAQEATETAAAPPVAPESTPAPRPQSTTIVNPDPADRARQLLAWQDGEGERPDFLDEDGMSGEHAAQGLKTFLGWKAQQGEGDPKLLALANRLAGFKEPEAAKAPEAPAAPQSAAETQRPPESSSGVAATEEKPTAAEQRMPSQVLPQAGTKVSWTATNGQVLTGTVRSIDEQDGTASVDTDQIRHIGGRIPIGRVETVPLERLTFEGQESEVETAEAPEPEKPQRTSPNRPQSDVDAKAAEIWNALDENQRTGVQHGLFPAEVMQSAEKLGFDGRRLSVALMDRAQQEPRVPLGSPSAASIAAGRSRGAKQGGRDLLRQVEEQKEAEAKAREPEQAPTPDRRKVIADLKDAVGTATASVALLQKQADETTSTTKRDSILKRLTGVKKRLVDLEKNLRNEEGKQQPALKASEPRATSERVVALRRQLEENNKSIANRGQAGMLRRIADAMDAQIAGKLNPAIANQNVTRRRSDIAAGMYDEGRRLQDVQAKLRALADAHESGTVPAELRGLKSRSSVEDVLSHPKFPHVSISRRDLQEILKATEGVKGLAESRHMLQRKEGDYPHLAGSDEIAAAEAVIAAAEKKGVRTKYMGNNFANAKRMYAAGITESNFEQARATLKQMGTQRPAENSKDRQIRDLERALIGRKIPGYFPTPKKVVAQMLDAAEIKPGMKVLEPSAGKGNIADAVREAHSDADLATIEWQSELRKILALKGHAVAGDEFLAHGGKYDRIVMNPPFEDGQDVDHVRHAYGLLNPGGRLVSIMGEHAFFANDKKSVAFREWLAEHDGTSEKLEQGSFQSSERPTGVATRMVAIEKPVAKAAATAQTGAPTTPKPLTIKSVLATTTAPQQSETRRGPVPDLAAIETKLTESEAALSSARREYDRLRNLQTIVADQRQMTLAERDDLDASEFGKIKKSDLEDEIRKHLILAARKYDSARISHDKALAEAAESNPMLMHQPEAVLQKAEVPVDEAADSNLKASTDAVSDAIAQIIEEEKLGDDEYTRNNVGDLQRELKYLRSDIADLEHASPDLMATAKETADKAQKLIDRLGAAKIATGALDALPDGKPKVVSSWLTEHRVSTVFKTDEVATYGNHIVYPLTDGRLVWASNTIDPVNQDIVRQKLVAVSPTDEDLEPSWDGKDKLRDQLEEAIGYGELKPDARDRILKMFDRVRPASAPPAKQWDGTPIVAAEPEVAPEKSAAKPTSEIEQIAARRPVEPIIHDIEDEQKQGLTKAQQAGLEYKDGWRSYPDLHPGQEQKRILEVFDPHDWKWLPAGTYTFSRIVDRYGSPKPISSYADEKLVATYPHVKLGPLTQSDLNEATKSFDASAPGVSIPIPKSVQSGMAKMDKIFSETALWKFRQAQINDAAAQLTQWRRAYERSKEWDDLFTSALQRVLSSKNARYDEGIDAERRQNQKLQSLADRFPESVTMDTVKAESEKSLGNEESLVAYKDGWRIVKYYYKGKQPTFSLQRFDPKNWEWDSSYGYAHNSTKARAEGEFKEYVKGEPLTEADLQKDVSDTRQTLKSYGKTKRTPEQIKAGEREQALPDHKPDMSKPFTYEAKGEDVRYYLNFPNGEKWGPSQWQANITGKNNIIDAWDGPRLNEEEAKSYAVARWWDAGLDTLRKERIYSGEKYDAKVKEMRDMAAAIMAPAGRPRVIATRQEGDFKREYAVIPTIRSNEHVGYQVRFKDPNGQWEQDHYSYESDGNTYDDAIEKWLGREAGDVSKYEFADPVAREIAVDLGKTNALKVDMNALAVAAAKAKAAERTRENDDLPQKVSLTLPNKTIKAMASILKRVVAGKPNIPILQNIAIVTKKGKTKIFATDLETSVTYTMDGISSEDGSVTLPFSAIEAAIKGKGKEDLTITADAGKADLSVGSAESSTGTMSIASYPELPVPTEKIGTIPATTLTQAIRATINSISAEESRFTLNGALLQMVGGKAVLVATDGHRLSLNTFDVPGVKGDQPPLLIGRHTLDTIAKVFAKDDGDVIVKVDKGADGSIVHIEVGSKDGSVKILTRKLTGNFPDWHRVMPDIATYTHKAVVGRKDLLGLMQQAVAMKERSNAVAISFRNGQLATFKKVDDKVTKGKVPAALEHVAAGKGDIGNPRIVMDAKYISDFLNSTDAEKVELELKSVGNKPEMMLLHPVGEPNTTTLIMPMREDAVPDFDDGLPPVKTEEAKPEEVKPAVPESDEGPVRASRESRPAAPAFYSQLERTIAQKMPARATTAQVEAIVRNPQNGVKQDEIDWTGFGDWLKEQKGSVSKRAALDFIHANQVQIQEVTKGDKKRDSNAQVSLDPQIRELSNWPADVKTAKRPEDQGKLDNLLRRWEEAEPSTPTKFGAHVLPGGESYREVLLTLPSQPFEPPSLDWRKNASGKWAWFADGKQVSGAFESEGSAEMARGSIGRDVRRNPAEYRGGHWSEPNVIAHFRMNDRVGPGGERILHMEESQSDWHQTGKRHGYQDRVPATPTGLNDREFLAKYFEPSSYDSPEGMRYTTVVRADTGDDEGNMDAGEPITGYFTTPHGAAGAALDWVRQFRFDRAQDRMKVPAAPFSKTWHELAFKAVLRYAVEHGYDALTWTTGAQQAERYDLSKQVDKIAWQEETGELYVQRKGEDDFDGTPIAKGVTRSNIADHIGKEAAENLLAQPNNENGYREIEGDDLRVGTAGMAGFYDKILPDFARKYGKKWGATVGMTQIPVSSKDTPVSFTEFADGFNLYNADGDVVGTALTRRQAEKKISEASTEELVSVHSIGITPSMRESIMQGQPLFAKGSEGKPEASTTAPEATFRHGVVWVNGAAMARLAKEVGESADANGFYVPPMAAQKLARTVTGTPMGAVIREAARAAQGGSVIIVSRDGGRALDNLKATVRHERFHQAMGNLMGAARGQILMQHPLAKIAAENLAERYDTTDEATMWAEIGAHLAAGPRHWERMGLDRQQAKDLFREYLRLLDDNTIRRIEHAHPLLNEVLHGENAIAEVRRGVDGETEGPEEGRAGGPVRRGVRPNLPAREPESVRLDREAEAEELRVANAPRENPALQRLKRLPGEETAQLNLGGITRFLNARFGSDAPAANYSGLGAVKSRYVRNLSQLEEASIPAHTAGLRAAGSRAQSSAILRAAVPEITKALEGSGVDWAEMRLALVESRLRGLRDRWNGFAEEAGEMSDHDLQQAFDDHFADLLGAMEGRGDMPDDILQAATVMAQDRDWDGLRDYLDLAFSDAAAAVATAMPPGQFERVTSQPGFRRALGIYQHLVENPMAENHAINEGVFSESLGPLDTYYPLIPVDRPTPAGPGRRLPYRKPKNIANAFATGLAREYEISMDALRDRLAKAVRANDKAALIRTLEEEGLLIPARPGQTTVTFDGKEYEAERVETAPQRQIIKDGKSIFTPARMGLMPRWLARELEPILERKPFSGPNAVDKVMDAVNTFAISGPADAIFHSANLLGALVANTPFLADTLVGKAASVPFVKRIAAMMYLLYTDPTTPEAAADIIEMAKVGALPDRYGSVTYSKRIAEEIGAKRVGYYSFSPTLYGPRGIDIRARVLMWRLAKAINPGATPQQLYHFVNQLGNYVPALQGEVERSLKASGWSPFYTAGSTMIRNGVNAWTGAGPMPKSGAALRLYQQLSGGGIVLLALWAVTYHHLTGRWPWEDKRAKFMQIPVGNGHGPIDQYRHSKWGNLLWGNGPEVGYVNFGFLNPLVVRGARAMGLPGAFEARVLGGNGPQQFEGAMKDVLNSIAHPVLGPAARGAFTAVFNRKPYLTGMRDDAGAAGPQLFPATPRELKPGFLGGLAPALYPNVAPRRHAGFAAETGARLGSSLRELNAFAGNLGENTGFLGSGEGTKGNAALRMVIDLAAPGLISNATNPFGKARTVEKQRRAMGK